MEDTQLKSTARMAGGWYLLLAVSGIMGFMVYHPQIFISDDVGKTVNNLIQHTSTARIRLVFELIIIVSQALAAVWFYKLFCGFNKWAATVLAIWGTVNAAVIMVSAIAMSAAIHLANAAVADPGDKTIMVQMLSEMIANSWLIGGLFFGLWLLPMGYLAIQSKRMPVWLGRTLLIGGMGYLLQTFLKSAGLQSSYLDMLVLPATIGELWMVAYLLIFGLKPAADDQNPA